MRPLRPSALLLLALLSGCATQPGDSDLEALLARHDYRAALALLDEEADDEPAAELREAARRWRRQQLDQAWQLAGQEEWRHGARVLAEADALLPAELGLTAERLAYTEHHYDFAREHMVRWALQRARHLALEQPALAQARRAALTPEQMGRAGVRLEEDRREVLALLRPAASLALERQQWRRAAELLEAMLALEPEDQQLARRLAHARAVIANADSEARQRQARARRPVSPAPARSSPTRTAKLASAGPGPAARPSTTLAASPPRRWPPGTTAGPSRPWSGPCPRWGKTPLWSSCWSASIRPWQQPPSATWQRGTGSMPGAASRRACTAGGAPSSSSPTAAKSRRASSAPCASSSATTASRARLKSRPNPRRSRVAATEPGKKKQKRAPEGALDRRRRALRRRADSPAAPARSPCTGSTVRHRPWNGHPCRPPQRPCAPCRTARC